MMKQGPKPKPITALKHGAQYAYKRGCRCGRCKFWKAEDMRAYRMRWGKCRARKARVGIPHY